MSNRAAAHADPTSPAGYGRDFRFYVAGRVVSIVGDRIAKIALVFLVIRLAHGFGPAVSLYYIAQLAPSVVGGLLAGVVADQVDRRRLMVVCDVARGALVAVVPVLTGIGVWTIFPLVVMLYAVTELFSKAATAAIPDVVPDARLTGANAILNGISASADFAYAVGGALIFVFGYQLPFYFDAATFGFSALMILGMRIPRQEIAAPLDVTAVIQRVSEGIDYLLRQPFLKWSTFALGVGALAGGITYVVTPLYASEALAKSPWLIGPLRGGPFRFSVLEVSLGIGYLVASATVARLASRRRRGHLFGAGLVGYGISYALLAPCGNLFVAAVLLAFGGFCNGLFIVTGLTLIQRLTPTEVRGRVFGANSTVINTSLVVGSAIGGGLLLVLPFAGLWLLLGGVIVLSSLFVWLHPNVRSEA